MFIINLKYLLNIIENTAVLFVRAASELGLHYFLCHINPLTAKQDYSAICKQLGSG